MGFNLKCRLEHWIHVKQMLFLPPVACIVFTKNHRSCASCLQTSGTLSLAWVDPTMKPLRRLSSQSRKKHQQSKTPRKEHKVVSNQRVKIYLKQRKTLVLLIRVKKKNGENENPSLCRMQHAISGKSSIFLKVYDCYSLS